VRALRGGQGRRLGTRQEEAARGEGTGERGAAGGSPKRGRFFVDRGQRMGYSDSMNVVIEFNPAAFKHGVSETDIRLALMNALYDDVLDGANDKHLVLGFDRNGNLLEILYNNIDANSINVFHAMSCRSIFFHLLDNVGGTYG
jgi:hypothetical protein